MPASRFGDIVLVPFPFTDQSATKKRPAIIVSSAAYHRARQDLIVMPITSQMRASGTFGDVNVQDWKSAGLLMPSIIKPVFATLHRSLVIKTLGTVSARDQSRLKEALTQILG